MVESDQFRRTENSTLRFTMVGGEVLLLSKTLLFVRYRLGMKETSYERVKKEGKGEFYDRNELVF